MEIWLIYLSKIGVQPSNMGIQPMNTGYEMICVCEWGIPVHHKNNILMCKMIHSRILGYCPFTNPKEVVQSVTTSNKRGGWINPCFFPFFVEVAQITKRISVPETDVKPVVQTLATRSWKCPVCSLQQFQVLDPSRGHQVNPIPLFVSPLWNHDGMHWIYHDLSVGFILDEFSSWRIMRGYLKYWLNISISEWLRGSAPCRRPLGWACDQLLHGPEAHTHTRIYKDIYIYISIHIYMYGYTLQS